MRSIEELVRTISSLPEGDATEIAALAAGRAALEAAIEGQASRGRRPVRWARPTLASLHFVPVLLSCLVVLLIGAAALTLSRHHAPARPTAGAVGSGPLRWSSPRLIDREPQHGASIPLHGVSCPTISLCVAVDERGNVLTSRARSGRFGRWQTAAVDPSTPLEAVSCPSASLCFAVDSAGNLVWSRDPAGDARAWHRTRIDAARTPLSGISCRSASLCVATERDGRVLSSENPTSAGVWSAIRFGSPGGGELTGVSCPSTSMCVVVDVSGNVWSTTRPTGSRKQWHEAVNVTPLTSLYSISCASPSLCVAGDDVGETFSSTNPTDAEHPRALWGTGTGSAWHLTAVSGSRPGQAGNIHLALHAISCVLPSLCVAADIAGHVVSSTNPTGGRRAWRRQDVDGTTSLTGVSCPTAKLCLAVDSAGQMVIGHAAR